MDNNLPSLEDSIRAAQKSAKNRQTNFWILSSIWIFVLLVGSLFFINLLHKFEENSQRIEGLSQTNKAMAERLEIQNKENGEINDRLIQLEEFYYQQLNEEARSNKIKDIAQMQIERQYISPAQKDFFNSEIKSRTNSNNADYWYLESFNQDDKQAINYLNKAIDLNPTMETAYFARGKKFNSLNNYEEAIADFTTALRLQPNNPATLAARAFSYFKLSYNTKLSFDQQTKFLSDALKDCEKSINLNPTDWVPYHYRGFINYKKKEYRNAEKDWREAASRRIGLSETASSIENISMIYLSTSNWEKAYKNCNDVKNLDDKSAWNWLFTYIATEKLKMFDLSKEAKNNWNNLKSKSDQEALQMYLPREFHVFLNE